MTPMSKTFYNGAVVSRRLHNTYMCMNLTHKTSFSLSAPSTLVRQVKIDAYVSW